MSNISWQSIVHRDAYLAGSIACREAMEGDTPAQTADSVGLTGEAREKFLLAWHDELVEQWQERNKQLVKEGDEAIAKYGKLWGLK